MPTAEAGSHGLDSAIRSVVCDGEDQLDGQLGARELLGGELRTGIVAFNDDIAAAAMSVLAQLRLPVRTQSGPGNVSGAEPNSGLGDVGDQKVASAVIRS